MGVWEQVLKVKTDNVTGAKPQRFIGVACGASRRSWPAEYGARILLMVGGGGLELARFRRQVNINLKGAYYASRLGLRA